MERPQNAVQNFELKLTLMDDDAFRKLHKAHKKVPIQLLRKHCPHLKKIFLTNKDINDCLKRAADLRTGAKWQRRAFFNQSVHQTIRRRVRFGIPSPFSNPKNRQIDDDHKELSWFANELTEERKQRREDKETIDWLFNIVDQRDDKIAEQKNQIAADQETIDVQKARLESITEQAADLLQRSTLKLRQIVDLADE